MFKTELNKMLYQKKLLAIFLIGIAAVLIFFLMSSLKLKYAVAEREEAYNSFVTEVNGKLSSTYANENLSDEEKERIISELLQQQDAGFTLQLAVAANNWQEELSALNALDEKAFGSQNQVRYDDLIEADLRNESPKLRIAFRNYLLANNIQPNFTIYTIKAVPFFLNICKYLLPFLLPLLAINICMLSVYYEYAEKTCKFLFQQPFPRSRILLSKLLSSFLFTAVATILILAVGFFAALIVNGKGDFTYPVRVHANLPFTFLVEGSVYMEAKYLFLLILAALPIVVAFFIVFSALLFTMVDGSTSITLALGISMAGMISTVAFDQAFSLFPFTVLNIYGLLTNLNTFSPVAAVLILVSFVGIITKMLFSAIKRKNIYLS